MWRAAAISKTIPSTTRPEKLAEVSALWNKGEEVEVDKSEKFLPQFDITII